MVCFGLWVKKKYATDKIPVWPMKIPDLTIIICHWSDNMEIYNEVRNKAADSMRIPVGQCDFLYGELKDVR